MLEGIFPCAPIRSVSPPRQSLLALSLCLGIGIGMTTSAASALAEGDSGAHASVQVEGVADIVRDPTDLPPSLAQRSPEKARIALTAVEVTGQLDDGTSYHYRAFDGKVQVPSSGCGSATPSKFISRTPTIAP